MVGKIKDVYIPSAVARWNINPDSHEAQRLINQRNFISIRPEANGLVPILNCLSSQSIQHCAVCELKEDCASAVHS